MPLERLEIAPAHKALASETRFQFQPSLLSTPEPVCLVLFAAMPEPARLAVEQPALRSLALHHQVPIARPRALPAEALDLLKTAWADWQPTVETEAHPHWRATGFPLLYELGQAQSSPARAEKWEFGPLFVAVFALGPKMVPRFVPRVEVRRQPLAAAQNWGSLVPDWLDAEANRLAESAVSPVLLVVTLAGLPLAKHSVKAPSVAPKQH